MSAADLSCSTCLPPVLLMHLSLCLRHPCRPAACVGFCMLAVAWAFEQEVGSALLKVLMLLCRTKEEALEKQLKALQQNDEPYPDHGIEASIN